MFGILLIVAGCTNSEETGTYVKENGSEHNIRVFLNGLLNGPNEEQEKLLEGPNGDLKKFVEKLGQYNVEHFKAYTSERFFEAFLNTNGTFTFLRTAHRNNYELKVEEISIEEKENYYDFTVKISYMKNKSKDSKTLDVRGHAQTNETDKITSINYLNFEEFRSAMIKG